MAEAVLLTFLAPSARPLAPQVTALPPLAAYHDLRWLFAFNQSWLGFTGVLLLLVVARSAVDAMLVMLAWPRGDEHSLPRPRFLASLVSCAVLTVLVGLVMSPVVTLMFGVALLPFSWPYLAAVPILLGTAVALSQGGVGQAWWRRLPPARTAAWVIATFGVLSLSSALMARLDTPAVVAVAGPGQRRSARGRGLRIDLLPQRELAARRRAKPAGAPVLLPGPERRRTADPVPPGREHVDPGSRRPDGRPGREAVPPGRHAGGR